MEPHCESKADEKWERDLSIIDHPESFVDTDIYNVGLICNLIKLLVGLAWLSLAQ